MLRIPEDEVWGYPIGDLIDQIEIYKQFNGMSKRQETRYIDEIFD